MPLINLSFLDAYGETSDLKLSNDRGATVPQQQSDRKRNLKSKKIPGFAPQSGKTFKRLSNHTHN